MQVAGLRFLSLPQVWNEYFVKILAFCSLSANDMF